jgi:hypothetical protein
MPLYLVPKYNDKRAQERAVEEAEQRNRRAKEEDQLRWQKGQSPPIPKTKALLTKIEDVYQSF